jgi:hypothetical protein
VTHLRRRLLLTALAATAAVGLEGTVARADFSARTTLPVSTATVSVAPPTGLSTAGTYCTTTTYDWGTTRTMNATVSWQPSPTRGVTGYQLTALLTDGSTYPIGTVAAGTTSASQSEDAALAEGARVLLTTQTSYGWTSTTASTGALTC